MSRRLATLARLEAGALLVAVARLGAGALLVAVALLPASPAAAHGTAAGDATNYRVAVTGISPAPDGLRVRTVEAGTRLELTNRSARAVEVLGYQGEPYLRVGPDGVHANVHSATAYRNAILAGDPAGADPLRPPSWQLVSRSPVVRWHDDRAHWAGPGMPSEVAADPGRPHRIRDWVVPLRTDMSTMEIRGTLDWLPPPAAAPWWALTLVAGLLLGALGLAWGRALPLLGSLAALGGLLAIGYAVARELDAGAGTAGAVIVGLLDGQVWPVLTGLAAIAAAVHGLRRRPAADFALGLAGACLALVAGVTNATLFTRSVAPVPGDPAWARVATALVIGVGFGLAVAAVLHMRLTRAAAPTRSPAATTLVR